MINILAEQRKVFDDLYNAVEALGSLNSEQNRNIGTLIAIAERQAEFTHRSDIIRGQITQRGLEGQMDKIFDSMNEAWSKVAPAEPSQFPDARSRSEYVRTYSDKALEFALHYIAELLDVRK